MSPNETLFLESTNKIYKDDISNSSFVNFQIWDFPGQMDFFDPTFDYEMIFRGTGALIYVIDAQVVGNDDVYFSSLMAEDVGTKEGCLSCHVLLAACFFATRFPNCEKCTCRGALGAGIPFCKYRI